MVKKHNYDKIISDYLSGLSLSNVAKIHHSDASSIRKIIIKTGNKTRNLQEAILKGAKHPNWKGGHFQSQDGYIVATNGYKVHRFVLETYLNKKLKHWEAVHHVDGNKFNNTLENLVVIPTREHTRFHLFLQHRNLSINKENLEKFAIKEEDFVYRFTVNQFKQMETLYPCQSSNRKKSITKGCMVKNCFDKSVSKGFCSKHYQRHKAKILGYWKSGKGRISNYCRP